MAAHLYSVILTKQDSEPPIWFLDVEGGRLELETDDLLNQNRFQTKVYGRSK